MRVSRKTAATVTALVAGILTFLKDQFGLAIDPNITIAALIPLITYVLFEAKKDLRKITDSPKLKDPKFWIAFGSVVLATVEQVFKFGIPVEAISIGVTGILSAMFGWKLKNGK